MHKGSMTNNIKPIKKRKANLSRLCVRYDTRYRCGDVVVAVFRCYCHRHEPVSYHRLISYTEYSVLRIMILGVLDMIQQRDLKASSSPGF
jgi:hypothetical protein